jgi:Zn-dependent peptidase ImmA (M78 family)
VDLRNAAYNIRKRVGLENQLYFPVVEFMEIVLPELIPDFEYEILNMDEMGVKHGETFPDSKKIVLREDVYNGAVDGKGRDRFTIGHEIKHCLFDDSERVKLYRVEPNIKIKPFYDPEWQANAFSGELLMPYHLMGGLSIEEIIEKCGVTADAAITQLKASKLI